MLVAGCVLAIFVVIELWFYRHERRVQPVGEAAERTPLRVHGMVNLLLLGLIIAAVIDFGDMAARHRPDHLRHDAATAGPGARRGAGLAALLRCG